MSEKEFIESLKELGVSLTKDQTEKFRIYADFLLEYNNHTNLTAIKDRNEVYLKHFYDSLLLSKYTKLKKEKVLDIGSGAGFPGIPLKIIFPDIKLTLIDANRKKTDFLTQLKSKLSIEYCVVNDRAENYIKKERECYDIVLSRAVTSMPILAELCIPFVKVGGLFIAYKAQIDETIENGIYAIQTLGGKVTACPKAILPIEDAIRTYVLVKKYYKTDLIYPRQFNKIIKKPLQKLVK